MFAHQWLYRSIKPLTPRRRGVEPAITDGLCGILEALAQADLPTVQAQR